MLFFCSDYHVFCTRLMRRRWVYILWRIYLWSCCNQLWINMPQLKCIPKGLSIDQTSFSKLCLFPCNTTPHLHIYLIISPPQASGLSCSSSFISLLLFCVICSTWPPSLYIQWSLPVGNAIKQQSLHWLPGAAGPSILCHPGNYGF